MQTYVDTHLMHIRDIVIYIHRPGQDAEKLSLIFDAKRYSDFDAFLESVKKRGAIKRKQVPRNSIEAVHIIIADFNN